jgi:hypothetical protein
MAISLVRARTAREANEIFAVETGQRTLLVELASGVTAPGVDRGELADAAREQVINSLGVGVSSAQLRTRYPVGGSSRFRGG